MTDNEIIKALEYCAQQGITSECERCEVKKGCRSELIVNALDVITRQKAEIERLCIEIDELIISKDQLFDEAEALIKKAKAEAIKEFADEIIAELALLAKHEDAFRKSVIYGVIHTIEAKKKRNGG